MDRMGLKCEILNMLYVVKWEMLFVRFKLDVSGGSFFFIFSFGSCVLLCVYVLIDIVELLFESSFELLFLLLK